VPINYTRAQLEGFLRAGHSVLVNGRHIDRVEDLPAESELAVGDRERARAALEAHDDQIARLVAERRKLASVAEGAPETPPPGSQSAPSQGAGGLLPPNAPGGPPPPAPPERQVIVPGEGPAPPPAAEAPPPREEDDRPGLFRKKK
jgi:hypothetical protein